MLIRLKKIDHLIILGNNYAYGCIFFVSLYYLRKWCRGEGGHLLEGSAYLTLWPRGRALIWGRVLITAWVLIWGNTLAYHCYRIKPIIFCANTIIIYVLKKGCDTFQIFQLLGAKLIWIQRSLTGNVYIEIFFICKITVCHINFS